MVRVKAAAVSLFVLLSAAAAAGCVGASEPSSGSSVPIERFDDAEGLVIEGLVVDSELVPVSDVAVVAAELDVVLMTDAAGLFRLPVSEPGEYLLVFEKNGYATQELRVGAREDAVTRVVVTLIPVALDVPYHETHIVFTYAQCWVSAGPAGAPCFSTVDYFAGTNLSQDKNTHLFRVEKPGLANLLIEIMYRSQALGKEAIIVVREPGSIYSGAQKSWLLQFGPSPIRAWLIPGKVGVGGRDKFEEPAGTKYMALIGGWGSNSTIPTVALHLEFRTQTHFNFFYNRPAPRDFTSLPDQ